MWTTALQINVYMLMYFGNDNNSVDSDSVIKNTQTKVAAGLMSVGLA